MIRVAAAGDIHFDRHAQNRLAKHFDRLKELADLFVIAGDLTQTGHPDEFRALAEDLKQSPVPVVAVFGNHDYHLNAVEENISILKSVGVRVLEKEGLLLNIKGFCVGIAGVKGFGGGFVGACGTEFGEMEMKEFMAHSRAQAEGLERCLLSLDCDYKIALLHYSPTAQTLLGEKKELYPFLGSYYLAEAVDRGGADIVFHGHAHHGVEQGETPGGTPVRNVAQPVIRHPFNVYQLRKQTKIKGIEFVSEVQSNVTESSTGSSV